MEILDEIIRDLSEISLFTKVKLFTENKFTSDTLRPVYERREDQWNTALERLPTSSRGPYTHAPANSTTWTQWVLNSTLNQEQMWWGYRRN